MAPWSRPRRAVRGQTIRAAAVRIDPNNEKIWQEYRKRRNDWQDVVWALHDSLGEAGFVRRYTSNMLSRVQLFPAWRPDAFSDPIPLDPTDPDQIGLGLEPLARAARIEMDRIDAGSDGLGAILGDLGGIIELVGEAYLVGQPDPDVPGGEQWDVFSNRELRSTGEGWKIYGDDNDNTGKPLADPDNSVIYRIWRRHPKYRDQPDSPWRSLIDDCESLLLLKQGIRAAGMSRLSAGILFIDERITFPDRVGESADQGEDEPFVHDLMSTMMTPVSDPQSAAALVPLIVKGRSDKEAGELIRHMTLARPTTETDLKLRTELRQSIAIGVDFPPEILLGMTDANHWTAWQIDAQTYKASLDPLVIAIKDALNAQFLRPALAEQGFDVSGVVIDRDPSDLFGDEDEFERAVTMHQEMVVNDRFVRRAGGANDEDAPDEDELARRRASQPAVPGGGRDVPPPGPVSDAGAPAEDGTRQAARVALVATSSAVSGTVQTAVALRSTGNLTRLGMRLTDMDRGLRRRVLEWSDASVRRSLEVAGARLIRKLNGHEALRAQLRKIPADQIIAHVGRDRLAQLGLTELEILDTQLGDLEVRYKQASKRTSQEALRQTVREVDTTIDDDVAAAYDDESDRNIDAGWLLLATGLRRVMNERLFDPIPSAPPQGEFDALTVVPAGMIRESLARAGGANTASPRDQTGRPSGGIATGDLVMTTLERDFGVTTESYEWLYGDAGTRSRPFELHMALDGLQFTGWDDPMLENSESFPDEAFFRPGDHDGCQCDAIPILTLRGE